jgi:hypothetical protein
MNLCRTALHFMLIALTSIWSVTSCSASDALTKAFVEAVTHMESKVKGMTIHSVTKSTDQINVDSKPPTSKQTTIETAYTSEGFRFRKSYEADTLGNFSEARFRVLASNELYAFDAMVDHGEGTLKNLQRIDNDPMARAQAGSTFDERGVLHAVCAGFYYGEPLWKIVNEDGFAVASTEEMNRDSKRLVKVSYSLPPRRGGVLLSDCSFICDPNLGWAIVEAHETRTYQDGKVDDYYHQFTHDGAENGVPIAQRVLKTITRRDGSYRSQTEFVITTIPGLVDERIFYCSHYGIPEPNFATQRRGRFLFSLASTIVLLVATIWFFWKNRQTNMGVKNEDSL